VRDYFILCVLCSWFTQREVRILGGPWSQTPESSGPHSLHYCYYLRNTNDCQNVFSWWPFSHEDHRHWANFKNSIKMSTIVFFTTPVTVWLLMNKDLVKIADIMATTGRIDILMRGLAKAESYQNGTILMMARLVWYSCWNGTAAYAIGPAYCLICKGKFDLTVFSIKLCSNMAVYILIVLLVGFGWDHCLDWFL
jgi:hypothetical protein